jgi:hypothetical protein
LRSTGGFNDFDLFVLRCGADLLKFPPRPFVRCFQLNRWPGFIRGLPSFVGSPLEVASARKDFFARKLLFVILLVFRALGVHKSLSTLPPDVVSQKRLLTLALKVELIQRPRYGLPGPRLVAKAERVMVRITCTVLTCHLSHRGGARPLVAPRPSCRRAAPNLLHQSPCLDVSGTKIETPIRVFGNGFSGFRNLFAPRLRQCGAPLVPRIKLHKTRNFLFSPAVPATRP